LLSFELPHILNRIEESFICVSKKKKRSVNKADVKIVLTGTRDAQEHRAMKMIQCATVRVLLSISNSPDHLDAEME